MDTHKTGYADSDVDDELTDELRLPDGGGGDRDHSGE